MSNDDTTQTYKQLHLMLNEVLLLLSRDDNINYEIQEHIYKAFTKVQEHL